MNRCRFLHSLGLLALAPYLAARFHLTTPTPPNRGDPVPIVQTGLFRMVDGSIIQIRPHGEPSVFIVQTADGHYHGGRAHWDEHRHAFVADRPLPSDRIPIMVDSPISDYLAPLVS